MPLTPGNIYGVLSLVFWTLTVIVSVKYVVLILRADNNGEGGLIAMLALASQAVRDRPRAAPTAAGRRHLRHRASSSATASSRRRSRCCRRSRASRSPRPRCSAAIVPITLVVLTGLFLVQRHGTGGVGRFFGPVMLVWFVVLAALGVCAHRRQPGDPEGAVSPHYALALHARPPGASPSSRSARSCCASPAPRRSTPTWATSASGRSASPGSALVMPALVLNYFGQGAMLLDASGARSSNPFYEMAPTWALYPLIVLRDAAPR